MSRPAVHRQVVEISKDNGATATVWLGAEYRPPNWSYNERQNGSTPTPITTIVSGFDIPGTVASR